MTTPADARAVEEAFEAALAGRPGPAGAEALTAFTDALRAEATVPGRPNAALAELLATGLLTDPSRTTVGRPARSSRKRPRMILSTLVVKFAAAGTVAKAAVAGGAVAVALTGVATATDVLPGTDEDTAVVTTGDGDALGGDDTTGGSTDDTAGGSTDDGSTDDGTSGDGTSGDGTSGDDTSGTDADADQTGAGDIPTQAEWEAGPEASDMTFSEWVSSGANAGLVRGEVVSCYARLGKPNGTTQADCTALATVPAPVEDDTTAPIGDDDGTQTDTGETGTGGTGTSEPVVTQQDTQAPAGNAGNPNGNAGGNGNAGNGGNGNGGGRR